MRTSFASCIAGLATIANALPQMPMDMDMKPAPPPKITTIDPLFRSAANPKSTRVELKYGPYKMPGSNDKTLMKMPGMEDEAGVVDVMLMNGKATKPCSDCTLKYVKADLTYVDGAKANLKDGAWLHHYTTSVVGPGRSDLACGSKWKDGERLFVVHNDRNESYFGLNGQDNYGYYLSNEDKMSTVLELKNDATDTKEVFLLVTYEYTPGKPANYKAVKPLWMDAQNCDAPSSEIEPPKNKKVFTVESKQWTSPIEGTLLTTVGHLHDGATHLEVMLNNKTVCDSKAVYGGNPEYVPTAKTLQLGAPKMEHITKYSPCADFGKIKKGDQISLKGYYDFEKNSPGLGTSGMPTGVMGIAMMYLGVD
ncbi:hypothetical protein E2P81_ATG06931 [Venturia nashicola]|nr:hypothetical protein E2P81_ATG06931 [Venturia nashicola]